MADLCIIPARSGSKRIPNKNIRSFLGEPIIAYAIKNALASDLFSEVMVSTDSPKIADMAKLLGASVPFLRSMKNSDDYATTADVILEVVQEYGSIGMKFESICLLYPTSPLLKRGRLKEGYEKMQQEALSTVFSVTEFSYPIQRSLRFKENKVLMNWPENLNARSQDLEAMYHDAGQFYWLRTEHFLREPKLFGENSSALVLDPLETQDIDTEDDWIMAELKYKMINKSKE